MQLIRVPLLNANEEEVVVVEVRVREGDAVRAGDLVCMIETTKATLDVEAPAAGFIRSLSVQKGGRMRVGAVICAVTATTDEAVTLPIESTQESSDLRATRKARELAEQNGLDLRELRRDSIIKEEDVRAYLAKRSGGTSCARIGLAEIAARIKSLPKSVRPVVIYGARGHAKILIDLVRGSHPEMAIVAAIDDSSDSPAEVLGVPVIGGSPMFSELRKLKVEDALLGIGFVTDPQMRKGVYDRLVGHGFRIPNLIHRSAVLEPSVSLGPAAQIFAGAIVGAAVRLGEDVTLNGGVIVAHDCVIGDHSHLTPGCILAGDVQVGESSLIGMGATVYMGVRIGSNVVISNGCHVMKDVPDGTIVRAAGGHN